MVGEPLALAIGVVIFFLSLWPPARRLIRRFSRRYYDATWPVSGAAPTRVLRRSKAERKDLLVRISPWSFTLMGGILICVGIFAR